VAAEWPLDRDCGQFDAKPRRRASRRRARL